LGQTVAGKVNANSLFFHPALNQESRQDSAATAYQTTSYSGLIEAVTKR
jgi:hypothetical protein